MGVHIDLLFYKKYKLHQPLGADGGARTAIFAEIVRIGWKKQTLCSPANRVANLNVECNVAGSSLEKVLCFFDDWCSQRGSKVDDARILWVALCFLFRFVYFLGTVLILFLFL